MLKFNKPKAQPFGSRLVTRSVGRIRVNRQNQCSLSVYKPVRSIQVQSYSIDRSDYETLTDMQTELDKMIQIEDYESAARIRDKIHSIKGHSFSDVIAANNKFYEAFVERDYDKMDAIWGDGEFVSCTHPGINCITTRELVMRSWKNVLNNTALLGVNIICKDARVLATTEVAVITCTEISDGPDEHGRLAATNVFQKQNGVWKIVHHQAHPFMSSR